MWFVAVVSTRRICFRRVFRPRGAAAGQAACISNSAIVIFRSRSTRSIAANSTATKKWKSSPRTATAASWPRWPTTAVPSSAAAAPASANSRRTAFGATSNASNRSIRTARKSRPSPPRSAPPIRLFETASVGDYLNHNIRLVYHVTPEDDIADLVARAEERDDVLVSLQLPGRAGGRCRFLAAGRGRPVLLWRSAIQPSWSSSVCSSWPAVDEDEDDEEEADAMDFDMI